MATCSDRATQRKYGQQRKYPTTSQTSRLVKNCHNDYDNDNPSIGVDEIMERNSINENKGKQDINQ